MPATAVLTEAAAPRRTMTYEAFIQDASFNHHEWVNGEVIAMGEISLEHNKITGFLFRLVASFLDQGGAGQIFYEPWNMKLKSGLPGRCPDLTVVLRKHEDRLRDKYLDGAADVVVEVVSPSSVVTDHQTKFSEYEAGGVPEYWLIDPDQGTAEFYHLDDRGRYQPMAIDGGIFRSRELPGFWLRVAWLWDRPLVREAEAELGLR